MKLIDKIKLKATDGKNTIADSKLFTYIDSDFKNWKTDKRQEETKTMDLEIYEITENATFKEIMSENPPCLTQSQILEFIKNHKDKLSSWHTFFPFKVDNEFFVADVFLYSDGRLNVHCNEFSDDDVWHAKDQHRVVLPQLNFNPSDLTLNEAIKIVKDSGLLVYESK